uniref:Uncharacterized protein n=1 Tax=Mantoniella antarctica TaxID=81844 RepID=A0A7S0S7W2_9CHLO
MQLHGDQAQGGGLLELTSFTILPESHPWTTADQKSLDGGNSFHGNTKIGVVIYSTVDKKRKGEVIIGDLSKIISLAARIRTSHALAFKHAVGRDPRSGDVCCGFAYNSGSRDSSDPSLPRKLVFGSLTFNLSGGQLIQDAFHGTNGDKTSKDYDKWASGEEQNLVRRVWDVYKNGPPYPPLPAMPVNAWRNAECKALEDALYSYGAGLDGDCRRACLKCNIARPFAEVAATAATLLDMVTRVGQVCKARADELEKFRWGCKVCAFQKKGRCGTETAHRSCLSMSAPTALLCIRGSTTGPPFTTATCTTKSTPPRSCLNMSAHAAAEDAGAGRGAEGPFGMDRGTWEATIAVCEAVLEARKERTPAAAASVLARMNTWKRLASGWQRATKCLKERAALAAVIEVPAPDCTPVTADWVDGAELAVAVQSESPDAMNGAELTAAVQSVTPDADSVDADNDAAPTTATIAAAAAASDPPSAATALAAAATADATNAAADIPTTTPTRSDAVDPAIEATTATPAAGDDAAAEGGGDKVLPPPELPTERTTFAAPQAMRGEMAAWWNGTSDTDLLRGSLRHGFSPWSQDMLQGQLEAIRTDETLSFFNKTRPSADAVAAAATAAAGRSPRCFVQLWRWR